MREKIISVSYEAKTIENDTVFETVTLPYPMSEIDGIIYAIIQQDNDNDIKKYVKFNVF